MAWLVFLAVTAASCTWASGLLRVFFIRYEDGSDGAVLSNTKPKLAVTKQRFSIPLRPQSSVGVLDGLPACLIAVLAAVRAVENDVIDRPTGIQALLRSKRRSAQTKAFTGHILAESGVRHWGEGVAVREHVFAFQIEFQLHGIGHGMAGSSVYARI